MRKRSNRFRLFIIGIILFGLLTLFIVVPATSIFSQNTPHRQMENAWSQAQANGRYQFETTILQTFHPTLQIENVGLTSRTEQIQISGDVDRPAELINMQMALPHQPAIELKLDGGTAYGRTSQMTDWERLETRTDLFIPGGDPLGFLNAAENVSTVSENAALETATSPAALAPSSLIPTELLTNVTRYQFDMSGPQYAAFMRDQLETELRQQGRLPKGISLSLAQEYVEMTGRGELWVSSSGLPVRQIMRLSFPAQPGADEWVEAQITTDFSNWNGRFAEAQPLDWENPGQALTTFLGRIEMPSDTVNRGLINGSLLFIAVSLIVFAVLQAESHKFRVVLNMSIVTTMLVTPLLQVEQASAFNDSLQAQQEAFSAQQEAAAHAAEQEAELLGESFDPHANPLLISNNNASDALEIGPSLPAEAVAQASDRSQLAAGAMTNNASSCVVTTTSDCDGDGLLDSVEIYELGTRIDQIDSDRDGISDNLEVSGFDLGGRTWYTDPRNPDSNGDGRFDGSECPGRYNVITTTINTAVPGDPCSDLDNDNAPDIYDFDDDGDGVPDRFDNSPTAWQTVTNKQFNFQMSGVTADKPLYVDIYLRPTDDQHLWWTNNYLDWPDNDRAGQIMRVTSETISTRGDMQLVPLLEVTLPYSADNPARGLPIKSSVTLGNITATTPITTWLDAAAIEPYGMSVSRGTGNDLLMYVPLNLVEDDLGGTPLAWSARMLYQVDASATNWGAAHTMRVIWTVQAVVDSCTPPAGQSRGSYCAGTTNWTSATTVIQTYPEDFIVTGITAQEDHGAETMLIGQTASAGGSSHYESQLWYLADVLQETYMQAENITSNQRMVLSDISTAYTGWGISASDLAFSHTTTITNEIGLYDAIDEDSAISFLGSSLYPTDPISGTIANVLYLSETNGRSLTLGELILTNNGTDVITPTNFVNNTFTMALSGTFSSTSASMRWRPYLFNTGGWTTAQFGTAVESVGSGMTSVFTNALLADITNEQLTDWGQTRKGATVLAQNFYMAVFDGIYNTVAHPDLDFNVEDVGTYTRPTEPVGAIVERLTASIKGHFEILSLSQINIPTTTGSAQAVGTTSWQTLADSGTAVLEAFGDTFTDNTSSAASFALLELKSFITSLNIANDNQLDSSAVYFSRYSVVKRLHLNTARLVPLPGIGYLNSDFAAITFVTARVGQTVKNIIYYTGKISRLAEAQNKLDTFIAKYQHLSSNNAYYPDAINKFSAPMKMAIESAKKWALIGFTKQAGAVIYALTATLLDENTDPDSAEFSYFLAYQVSTLIVAVVQASISIAFAASGVGQMALAILGLVDLLIAAACAITNAADPDAIEAGGAVDQWVCGGITGALTRAIAYIINDFTPLVDLDHGDRLDMVVHSPQIAPTTGVDGPVVGNRLTLSATVTNTLYMDHPNWMGYIYYDQLVDDNLDDAAFAYRIQEPKNDFDGGLEYGDTSWLPVPGRGTVSTLPDDARFFKTFPVTGDYTYTSPGVNVGIPLHFSEAFVTPVQNCWLIPNPLILPPVVPVCWLQRYDATNHQSLQNNFIYDVFPATLDGFNTLVQVNNDSYRLAWSENFPTLMDGDGDGLISKAFNGIDPDDSSIDTDGDGLTDAFEINNAGFDPQQADADCDGLIDYWEAFYETDPSRPDTDNDGLLDSEETLHQNNLYPFENSTLSNNNVPICGNSSDTFVGGWEIVYDYDGTIPLTAWVNANPLDPDSDDDSLIDGRERIYGYHPGVVSTLNLLGMDSTLETSSDALPYVASTDTITYTANITNELDNRYMLGLLQTELPLDTVIRNQSLGVLQPKTNLVMNGTVNVNETSLNSNNGGMGIRAGANIAQGTGRVLWLHMNEPVGSTTFRDDSYLQNDATCSTCPTANSNYLAFDSNSSLSVADSSAFDLTTFSAGFSLYHTAATGNGTIFEMNSFRVRLVNSAIEVSTNLSTAVFTNVTIPEDKWVHIMVTVENSNVILYVNGVQQRSTSSAPVVVANSNNLYMGWSSGAGSIWMDEVELFSTLLNSTTIGRNYGKPVLAVDLQDNTTWGSTDVSCSGDACPIVSGSGAMFSQVDHLMAVAPDLSNDTFTFATWIKPIARPYPFDVDTANAFGYWNDMDYQGVFGYTDPANDKTIFPTLHVAQDGRLRMTMGDGTTSCEITTNNTAVVQNDIWQHLVIAYDGSNFTFYINGEAVSGGTNGTSCASVTPPTVANFNIGRPNQFGYVFLEKATFDFVSNWPNDYYELDDANGNKSELRINWNGDGSGSNIWSHSASDSSTSQLTFNKTYRLLDGETGKFRFWDNDVVAFSDDDDSSKEYINDFWQQDDSFVHVSNIRNITYLGTTSNRFDKEEVGGSSSNPSYHDTEGYFHWDVSNEFFNGQLDDFRVYDYNLTPEAIAAMFRATYSGLEVSFNEPPGTTFFADSSGNNITVSCSGDTCPISGLPGRVGQALEFDGVDDYLSLSATGADLAISGGGWTVMTWVKGYGWWGPSGTHSQRAILGSAHASSYMGARYGRLMVRQGSFVEIESTSNTVNSNWNHIAYVFDGSASTQENIGVYKVFINGVEVDQERSVQFAVPGEVIIGNAGGLGHKAFKGLMDELRILKYPLTASEIQAEMAKAPILNLHLDEDNIVSSYRDETENGTNGQGYTATCSGATCPEPGNKGQIREAAVFDGTDSLTVSEISSQTLTDFTVGLWVKPTQRINAAQRLLNKSSSNFFNANFRLWLLSDSLTVRFDKQTACANSEANWQTVDAGSPLLENQWNHVVATHDSSSGTMNLYINGSLSATNTTATSNICTQSNPIYIGQGFHGSLDEIGVTDSVLNATDVSELFNYQSAWYDKIDRHPLLLDADAPTADVSFIPQFVGTSQTAMFLTGSDPTTQIDRIEYRINGGSWQAATPDLAQTQTTDAWLFYFPASAQGSHTIEARATDSVGNVSAVVQTAVYVDGTPPNLSQNVPSGTQPGSQAIAVNGTVTDANSGLVTNAVQIGITDHAGSAPVDNQWLNINPDGTWATTLTLPQQAYGQYTITTTARDTVANQTTTSNMVTLDGVAPYADVTLGDIYIHPGQNVTVHGIASDIPHQANSRNLHLHFEAGAGQLIDGSKNKFTMTCTQCPTSTTGQHGDAVSFNGTNHVLDFTASDMITTTTTAEQLGLIDDSFTVMAWVKASNWSGDRAILGSSPATPADGLYLGLQNGAPFFGHGGADSVNSDVVPTNEWAHIAWRYDKSEGERTIFINGLTAGTVITGQLPLLATDDIQVGRARGGNFYSGDLDELVVYGQALSDEAIYDIANPLAGGISDLQIRFRPYADREQSQQAGTWYPVTLSSNTSNFVPWNFAMPNNLVEGSYKIDLKVMDAVSPANSSFMGGAWDGVIIKPDLAVAKVADTNLAALSGDVGYTITYTNTGVVETAGVVITEIVPVDSAFNAGLSHPNWDCQPDNAAGSLCSYAVPGTLSAGSTGTISFTVTLTDTLSPGTLALVNNVDISHPAGDIEPLDNSASVSTAIDAGPDLWVTIAGDGNPLHYDDSQTYPVYTINYGNTGSQIATAAVSVLLPEGGNSTVENFFNGWGCGSLSSGSTCVNQVGDLAPGASGTITFTLAPSVYPPQGNLINNTVSITDTTGAVDLNSANNSDSTTTPYILGFAILPAQEAVVVNEGETAVLTGTVEDSSGAYTLMSPGPSIGTIVEDQANQAWEWSYNTSDGDDESQLVSLVGQFNEGTVVLTHTFPLTVVNVVPTIGLTGADSVLEDTTYTLQLGNVVDPGNDTVTACTINWGDGSSEDCFGAIGGGSLNHVYTEPLTVPLITVDLTDEDGTHLASGSKSVTVDSASVLINVVTDTLTIDEGGTMLVVNSGLYSPTDGSVTLSASEGVVIDNGDGTWDWSYDTSLGAESTRNVTITASGGGSDTAVFALTVNGDGVDGPVEDSAMSGGDVNADGTRDRYQRHVASLPISGGSYVSLQTDFSLSLRNVAHSDTPPATVPPTVSFPVGFVDATISDLTLGDSVTVTLWLEDTSNINSYYKYGKTPDNNSDHWYEFLYDIASGTGAEILPDRIILHFVDGARGDNDLTANGVVVDPGGPAFEIPTYDLVVNQTGQGAVTPGTSSYLPGAVVNLTAVPDPGWSFTGWTGAITSTNTSESVTINSDLIVNADFTQNRYSISTTKVGSGNIVLEPAQDNYFYGDVVTVTAVPELGWTLDSWSGDLSGSSTSHVLVVDGDKSLTATFGAIPYSLNTSVTGSGSVVLTPDQASYVYGDEVLVEAVPTAGWSHTGWSGDLSGEGIAYTLTITENKGVTAAFAQDVYTVTLTSEGSGAIQITPDLAGYAYGDEVTVTAVPDPGYTFDGWLVDATGVITTQNLIVDSNKEVVAQFSPIAYTVNLDPQGNGTILVDPVQTSYGYGDVITVTAVADPNHVLLSWGGDLSGTMTLSDTLVIDDHKSIVGVFVEDNFDSFTPNLSTLDATTLTWDTPPGSCTFDLYASNDPYGNFALRPDGNDLQTNTYDIAADIADTSSHTYYYVVVDTCDPSVFSYPSNKMGEFNFSIVPGD